MCKFIGKSNERILFKLSESEILRLYSIVYVTMETMKRSTFTCQSNSFISIFFTCQISACELYLSLAMIWRMTHTHKLQKLCSATLTVAANQVIVGMPQLFRWVFAKFYIFTQARQSFQGHRYSPH